MTNVKRYVKDNRSKEREEMMQTVYDFIVSYKDEWGGVSPSLGEIADGCYMSRSNVVRYLDILEARGHIEREHNVPRSIRLIAE